MSADDHIHRPQPTRQGPNRQYPPLKDRLGGTARMAQATAPASGTSDGTKTVDQVVAEAVRAGYEVVEENIRQGRQAAERLRLGTYRSAEIPEEMRMMINRVLKLGRELSTTSFELIAAMMRDAELLAAFEDTGHARAPRTRRGSDRPPRIAYRVRCSRMHEVEFSPTSRSEPAVPTIAGLFSLDADAPPIRNVAFKSDPDANSLVVQIDVPDEQPPGMYNGVVIDADAHEPIGTLRLRIHS